MYEKSAGLNLTLETAFISNFTFILFVGCFAFIYSFPCVALLKINAEKVQMVNVSTTQLGTHS